MSGCRCPHYLWFQEIDQLDNTLIQHNKGILQIELIKLIEQDSQLIDLVFFTFAGELANFLRR